MGEGKEEGREGEVREETIRTSIVKTPIRDLDKLVLNARALRQLRGVHEVGRAHLLRPGLLAGVRVDGDDARGFDEGRGGDDAEADGAAAKHGDGGVRCEKGEYAGRR